jgi:hypothetical protein
MEVKDVLSVALAKAITDSVSVEMQKEIFSRALYDHLFYETKEGRVSPLKEAFARALNEASVEQARLVMADPANLAKVRDAFQTALDTALTDGSLVKKMTEKMVSALRW